MFGGQTDATAAPFSGGGSTAQQDDPLKGVTDLVGGAVPAPSADTASQGGTFLPRPADAPASGAPTLPGDGANTGGAAPNNTELLGLKQQALQQLTPLVSHLEQTPLEKFRTTMMLIQASDNQALLKDAYEAAQKIEDEKIRAQALLDVVNEINYFTQQKEQA